MALTHTQVSEWKGSNKVESDSRKQNTQGPHKQMFSCYSSREYKDPLCWEVGADLANCVMPPRIGNWGELVVDGPKPLSSVCDESCSSAWCLGMIWCGCSWLKTKGHLLWEAGDCFLAFRWCWWLASMPQSCPYCYKKAPLACISWILERLCLPGDLRAWVTFVPCVNWNKCIEEK